LKQLKKKILEKIIKENPREEKQKKKKKKKKKSKRKTKCNYLEELWGDDPKEASDTQKTKNILKVSDVEEDDIQIQSKCKGIWELTKS
jgi:hypothetical protein